MMMATETHTPVLAARGGSFLIEELTDLIEEAVLKEFEAISERGGVLGAMETAISVARSRRNSLY